MASTRVAKRYAHALIDLAAEQNALDAVYGDIKLVGTTISENRELELMLKSPVVKAEKKAAVLEAIFKSHVQEMTMRFMLMVTRKMREDIVTVIIAAFIERYKELKNITSARVTSAVELTDEARQRITSIVQEQVGGSVELETSIDPELIGGFVLRVGDRQLDTTISRKLNDMQLEFGKKI